MHAIFRQSAPGTTLGMAGGMFAALVLAAAPALGGDDPDRGSRVEVQPRAPEPGAHHYVQPLTYPGSDFEFLPPPAQGPYEIPPGWMIIEGDILVPETFYIDLAANDGTYNANLWPDGIVPYEFDANVNATNQQRAINAMANWEAVSDVTFVPRSGQANFVHIQNSTVNSSAVGMVGGQQNINIVSWTNEFIISHELGHALGLWHEQSRTDRDTYVTIIPANIQAGAAHNFDIVASSSHHGPYDFDSVMHYGECFFSNCAGCPTGVGCAGGNGGRTIVTVNPANQNVIGQRNHLSTGDVEVMAFLYAGLGGCYPFGGTLDAFSGTNRFRGNGYTVDATQNLSQIKMELDFTGTVDIYWYVAESASGGAGTYNVISETVVSTAGVGQAQYSSGPVSVQLDPGMFYLIGAAWGGSTVGYFRDPATLPRNWELGTVELGAGDNSATPPVTSLTVTNFTAAEYAMELCFGAGVTGCGIGQVYAQSPPDPSLGARNSNTPAAGVSTQQIADDFVIPGGASITNMTLWGVYFLPSNMAPPSQDFVIDIYADVAGNPGAAPIYTATVSGVTPVDTGLVQTNNLNVFEYQITLDTPFNAAPGTRYWLVPLGDTGTYQYAWQFFNASGMNGRRSRSNPTSGWTTFPQNLSFELCGTSVPRPRNDDCANAIPIMPGITPFDTTNATTDGPEEPQCGFCCGDPQVNQDIWYRWTSPCDGKVMIDLCNSQYDTKIAIYEGPCPTGPGTAIACNDDAGAVCASGTRSYVEFCVTANTRYLIRVGGFSSATGAGEINFRLNCCPGDTNGDMTVDVLDLLEVLTSWGACPGNAPCPGDVNCDGTVDVLDLLIVLTNWGPCGPGSTVVWNEAVNGDLSGDRFNPTPINVAPGGNTIIGTVGGGGDDDYFRITVPAGNGLQRIIVDAYSSANPPGNTTFLGVNTGPIYDPTGNSSVLGWTQFGVPQIGMDILPLMAASNGMFVPPLPPGTYSFWVDEAAGPEDYTLTLVVGP